MSETTSSNAATEVVGLFESTETLEAAIDELQSSGFDRAELSLVASTAAVEEKLGHIYEKASELEDDPSVPRTAYVSTESIGDAQGELIGALVYVGAVATAGAVVASGGPLAAAIVGAAMSGSAGALVGSVLAKLVGEHHARYLQDHLDRGGLLLWVRARDKIHEQRATRILEGHSARDVHAHTLPLAA